jgi:hypothetical protein
LTDPTYTITVIVERSDEPTAKFKAVYSDIPRTSAEDQNYFLYPSIETFRRCCLDETRPDPREG